MSRKWLLFLFCLCITPALVWSSEAKLTVRVNEANSKVLFTETDTRVLLALDNALGRRVDAHIRLELIDLNGQVEAKAVFDDQIKPGAHPIDIPVGLTFTKDADTRDLLWYRLRYQVAPRESGQFDPSSGVISLSEITPDLFSLQVIAPRKVPPNSAYRLRARTVHPRTARAIAGVIIDAELKFDGYDRDDIVLKQSVRTGENGLANLDFQIPAGVESDEGELDIVAHRGVLRQSAESDVDIDQNAQIMVSTDKPLYQPGQTIHTRLLMFDGLRRALRNQKATVKIVDPESTTAFRTEVTTTRFGVASADWTIPENTRLGDYLVEVELEDRDTTAAAAVKISRYDLPNFTVNVTPDRTYYLRGQDAEVRVRGDYLFGQQVKRGHVRVVRESERRWNYREQKYETEEGDTYEGKVDADGNFIAHIKLGDEHAELKDEDYSRYRDLSYAAYFTDASTNRTEQRRFDLRLSKNSIHVYIISQADRQSRNSPFDFYISTSYADGSPASCDVAVSRVWETENLPRERSVQTFRTNRYGLARVSSLRIPKEGDDPSEVSLMFRARDAHGADGEHAETVYLDERTTIRVKTDKSLYRDGEPIRAEVTASVADLTVLVDIVNEKQVLQSKTVRLQSGHAVLTIPYRPEFRGALTIAAYAPSAPDDNDVTVGTRTALYPHDRDLKLKMDLSRESYRPGEDVSASFLALTATGRMAESVLGVVIFDKAVEERARTNSEFGGAYGFYSAYRQLSGSDGDVAGVTLKDLEKLDLSRPLPEGIDLVAEILLKNYSYEPRLIQGNSFESYAGNVFSSFVNSQISPLKSQLESEYKTTGSYPTNEIGLRQLALRSGINLDEARDPWATPYQFSFSAQRAANVLQITSAGPDKTFGNDDDFTALRIEWPYFRFTGEAINRAVFTFYARTGHFIRDAATLTNELRFEGIDLNGLRDPWGQPYQLEFAVNQTDFRIYVRASGPDRQFSEKDSDDVLVWTTSINYARDLQAKAEAALTNYFRETSQFPQSQPEFSAAMTRAAIKMEELVDPWGRSYYVTFRQNAVYGDRVKIFSYANYGEKPKDKLDVVPVTRQINYIDVRSSGEDGKEGTADDFNIASFSRTISEQSAEDGSPQPVKPD